MPEPQSNFKKVWVFLELTFSSTSELLNHPFLALIHYIHNCSAWEGDISRNGSSAWQRTQHCWKDKSKVTRPCRCQRAGTPRCIGARRSCNQLLEFWWRLKLTNIANAVIRSPWYALLGFNTNTITSNLLEGKQSYDERKRQVGKREGKKLWHKLGRRGLPMDRKNKLSLLP